jgi:hypothetical protein
MACAIWAAVVWCKRKRYRFSTDLAPKRHWLSSQREQERVVLIAQVSVSLAQSSTVIGDHQIPSAMDRE